MLAFVPAAGAAFSAIAQAPEGVLGKGETKVALAGTYDFIKDVVTVIIPGTGLLGCRSGFDGDMDKCVNGIQVVENMIIYYCKEIEGAEANKCSLSLDPRSLRSCCFGYKCQTPGRTGGTALNSMDSGSERYCLPHKD